MHRPGEVPPPEMYEPTSHDTPSQHHPQLEVQYGQHYRPQDKRRRELEADDGIVTAGFHSGYCCVCFVDKCIDPTGCCFRNLPRCGLCLQQCMTGCLQTYLSCLNGQGCTSLCATCTAVSHDVVDAGGQAATAVVDRTPSCLSSCAAGCVVLGECGSACLAGVCGAVSVCASVCTSCGACCCAAGNEVVSVGGQAATAVVDGAPSCLSGCCAAVGSVVPICQEGIATCSQCACNNLQGCVGLCSQGLSFLTGPCVQCCLSSGDCLSSSCTMLGDCAKQILPTIRDLFQLCGLC
jgi:hypothetical protein